MATRRRREAPSLLSSPSIMFSPIIDFRSHARFHAGLPGGYLPVLRLTNSGELLVLRDCYNEQGSVRDCDIAASAL